jgi:CHAT domain-containing protein/tetratricopeptide (TPR) repeat protein
MRLIAFISLLLLSKTLLANADEKLAELQNAISEEDYITAQKLFNKDTTELINQRNFLELSYFIPYAGYIADHFGKDGMKAVEDFRDFILNNSHNLRDQRQAFLEIHTYYRDNGKFQLAYDMNAKALEISHRIPDCEPREWAMIERNLGVIATELHQPVRAKGHALKAVKGFDLDPRTDKPDKLNTYNTLGAIYWYEAKYDSVEYFWTKGLTFLDSMDQTLVNQYYYRAMLEGNLSALYDVTGRTDKSIESAKNAIRHTKYFIENGKKDPRWNRSLSSLLYQSNNLAATYQGIGNYSQALKLFEFILQEKLENYPDNHPETFFSKIQVGRNNYDLKNYAEAKEWLKKGIDGYINLGDNYDKNLADAYSTLAFIAEEEGSNEEAENYYKISEEKYSKAFKEKFDFVYLDFLTHVSEFYSLNDNPEKAVELAKKGLDYITKSYSKNSLVGFRQNLNVGNVWYNLKEYEKSLKYAEECLEILDNIKNTSDSGFDSLRTYFDKPSAVLLKEKSAHELQENKSEGFLQQIHQTLKEALAIVDKRKTVLAIREDQQMLTVRFKELIEFTQKILLELYGKTGNMDYIDELVMLQENMVYTKIRSQLYLIENIDFYNLPKEISSKEDDIRTELQNLIDEGGSISDYLQKMNEWEDFLMMLKLNYSEYYKLRYSGLPAETTINSTSDQTVKYIFIGSDLLAIVYTKDGQKVFKLNFDAGLINQIPKVWDDPQRLGKITSELYQQLWEPFDSLLKEPRVLVIPDGILFNLSFEMLTPMPVSRFAEFSENSLLAKYDFSYHFSLWLAQYNRSKQIKSRYVGFVPGFSDQMKENYVSVVADSFAIDEDYLRLLPQPFTVKLVNTISKRLRGKIYAHEESTATTFRQKASGNKIIHIGTHAESDNVSPAYSRLLFAKSGTANDDNSLYAYEIYGTKMISNITLLTACETGKPGFQPGEGMISLAHAFQYSGSESMLTSLWNQDEKAGMEISGYFLKLLSRGIAKDKALKEAKLKYLAKNDGRSLSPQYWAGLILVGNPESLEGLKPARTWYWIGGGIVLILLILYIFIYRKREKQI